MNQDNLGLGLQGTPHKAQGTSDNFKADNPVAKTLNIIGFGTFAVGTLGGIIMSAKLESFIWLFICLTGSFISGMIFIALAEIIKQLQVQNQIAIEQLQHIQNGPNNNL